MLLHEVQQTDEDLLFEGSSPFLKQTDTKLHGPKDTRATLKSTPIPSRKHYRPEEHLQSSSSATSQDLQRKRNRRLLPLLPMYQCRHQCQHHLAIQRVLSRHFDERLEDAVLFPLMPDAVFPLFANHLSHFISAWSHITMDHWVLSTIEVGYTLQFISASFPFPFLFRDPSQKELLVQRFNLSFGWEL